MNLWNFTPEELEAMFDPFAGEDIPEAEANITIKSIEKMLGELELDFEQEM